MDGINCLISWFLNHEYFIISIISICKCLGQQAYILTTIMKLSDASVYKYYNWDCDNNKFRLNGYVT